MLGICVDNIISTGFILFADILYEMQDIVAVLCMGLTHHICKILRVY